MRQSLPFSEFFGPHGCDVKDLVEGLVAPDPANAGKAQGNAGFVPGAVAAPCTANPTE